MPRTNLCKPSSKIAADKVIKWIRGQDQLCKIADGIGISKQVMTYKMKHNSFTLEEIMKIFHYLQTETDDIGKLLKY